MYSYVAIFLFDMRALFNFNTDVAFKYNMETTGYNVEWLLQL